MESPSPSRLFLLFRSSLHISQNTLSINWLILTEHPFIPLSAVLPKLLSNLPSAFVCRKNLSRRKKFYKWKEAERVVARCPFTTEIRHNRAFQRLMKGGRKRQIFPFVWRKTQFFLWIQSLHGKPLWVFHDYCLFSPPSSATSMCSLKDVNDADKSYIFNSFVGIICLLWDIYNLYTLSTIAPRQPNSCKIP